jgi:hypothetical protein
LELHCRQKAGLASLEKGQFVDVADPQQESYAQLINNLENATLNNLWVNCGSLMNCLKQADLRHSLRPHIAERPETRGLFYQK